MKLVVKSPVWDDLREIGQRIAKDNPDAAGRFFDASKGAFELVARHPAIGCCEVFRCRVCGRGGCRVLRIT